MPSYEAIVYDERDRDSDSPSSTIGTFDTYNDALSALITYCDGYFETVYKVEVIKIK